MVDRGDLERLNEATRSAANAAYKQLKEFMARSASWPPSEVRDGLIELMKALVNEYGDVASAAAAEWYEQVRADDVSGSYKPVSGYRVPDKQIEGTVRAASRHLFKGNPELTMQILGGALQRYITGQARTTIERNSLRDSKAKMFARVPRGARTCAFCLVMASKGFVYTTAEAAGEMRKYHDDCDCQIVPSFSLTSPKIDGYDPDALYKVYETARNAAIRAGVKDPGVKHVAAQVRERFPDKVTDGKRARRATVVNGKYVATDHKTGETRALSFGPKDAELTNANLTHILEGDTKKDGRRTGGHAYWTVAEERRESQIAFPESWDDAKILEAVDFVLNSPLELVYATGDKFFADGWYSGVYLRVQFVCRKNGIRLLTAHPMHGSGVVRVHNGALAPVE